MRSILFCIRLSIFRLRPGRMRAHLCKYHFNQGCCLPSSSGLLPFSGICKGFVRQLSGVCQDTWIFDASTSYLDLYSYFNRCIHISWRKNGVSSNLLLIANFFNSMQLYEYSLKTVALISDYFYILPSSFSCLISLCFSLFLSFFPPFCISFLI